MAARKPAAPFVRTLTQLAAAGGVAVAAFATGASVGCSNPPMMDDCPSSMPDPGTACTGRVSCSYQDYCGSPTTARCAGGTWEFTSQLSCNPPPPLDTGVDWDTALVDTGVIDADARTGACPTAEPSLGASCDVVATAVCSFPNLCPLPGAPTSTEHTWRCLTSGKWSFDQQLATSIACPKDAPVNGEACGCAMYLPASCSWSTACGGATGTCDGATQRWKMTFGTCSDAGPTDAPAASDAPASDAPASDAPASDAAVTTDAPASDAGPDAAPSGETSVVTDAATSG